MTFDTDRSIAQAARAQQAAAMLRATQPCGYLAQRRAENARPRRMIRDHNHDWVPCPEAGEGYRLLEPGEIHEGHDEVWSTRYRHWECVFSEFRKEYPKSYSDAAYRRSA